MKRHRTLGLLSAVLVLALAFGTLAGCSQTPAEPDQSGGEPPAENAKAGGALRIAMTSDPQYLNAIMTNNSPDLYITNMIFEPLVTGGENWGLDQKGLLAESWEVSDDGLVWTFHLRKDVKWHDGEPFTADDVLFTFETVQADNGTEFQNKLFLNGEPIKFEAPDDYTVVATLPSPLPSFLTQVGIPIVPKHLLEGETDLAHSDFNSNPVGTGPFRFVSWESGQAVTLDANPDYYLGKPYLDQIVFKVVPSNDSGLIALQSGELDFFGNVPYKNAIDLQDDPNVDLKTQTVDLIAYVMMNTYSNEKLQDKRVRQAMAYAIDKQSIIDSAYYGYADPADSFYTKGVFAYQENDPLVTQYAYDPDQAKQLLADAGYTDANSDGYVEGPDGERLSFELMEISSMSIGVEPILQAQLKDVGIEVKIRSVDVAAALQASANHEFDLWYLGGSGLKGRDPDAWSDWFDSDADGNWIGWENADVRDLFEQARSITDEDQRTELYREAAGILSDEVPYIPVAYPQWIAGYGKNVQLAEAGLDLNKLPWFQHPEKIWIQK